MFKIGWGHRTFQLRLYDQMLKQGLGHCAQFKDPLEAKGGHHTFHFRISGKIFKRENPYGGVDGWVVSFRKYCKQAGT